MIIGYAAGAYDLFHYGHLEILRKAKENCDYLIAGVVHDDVLEVTKGRRPVIPIEERAAIVSHIDYVDEVHVETTPDKLETWKQKPFNVFFKGDDWKGTDKGNASRHASQRSAWRYTTSPTPNTPPAPSCARLLTCSKQSTTCV